jgi:hypothetical protein
MLRRLALLVPLVASCGKVPLRPVDAGFALADVAWFAEEETVFVFHQLFAEQGINPESRLEIRFTTNDGTTDWTPVRDFEPVHTHLDVDCGPNARCGSWSFHLPLEPRNVTLRLRYHPDGELALVAPTTFNAVGRGPAHDNRSLIVYGVFGRLNERIQWRARHQFPTVRNEQATLLGLRREWTVEDPRYGRTALVAPGNPYGYGVTCPPTAIPLDWQPVGTDQRAAFAPETLPTAASASLSVCADATVTDALGTFTTTAAARKNPEVRPAFPRLESPIRDATPVKFFLAPCERTIEPVHEEMQRQRLQMEDTPTTCTDDWENPLFEDSLVVLFRDAVEAERAANNDMVLVIGLHQDERGVPPVVERALSRVLPGERHRTSPRLAGAFVFDSVARTIDDDSLSQTTLWCPSTINAVDNSAACAVLPVNPQINLGPLSATQLPILPPRGQLLDFLDEFGANQAGQVEELSWLTPEFAATADHVDSGDFGLVTFLNNERISAEVGHAFSFCATDEIQNVAFRSALTEEFGEAAAVPVALLPDWHNAVREADYELGLFWDFPFLLELDYRTFAAGAVAVAGFSVPFGIGSDEVSYYGSPLWRADSFPIGNQLQQCTRFCDHPTFDSAGVYKIMEPYRETYAQACYRPAFPDPNAFIGFPRDP